MMHQYSYTAISGVQIQLIVVTKSRRTVRTERLAQVMNVRDPFDPPSTRSLDTSPELIRYALVECWRLLARQRCVGGLFRQLVV